MVTVLVKKGERRASVGGFKIYRIVFKTFAVLLVPLL